MLGMPHNVNVRLATRRSLYHMRILLYLNSAVYINVCIYVSFHNVLYACLNFICFIIKVTRACVIMYYNTTSFFRFVDKREIYRWYNLIRASQRKTDPEGKDNNHAQCHCWWNFISPRSLQLGSFT